MRQLGLLFLACISTVATTFRPAAACVTGCLTPSVDSAPSDGAILPANAPAIVAQSGYLATANSIQLVNAADGTEIVATANGKRGPLCCSNSIPHSWSVSLTDCEARACAGNLSRKRCRRLAESGGDNNPRSSLPKRNLCRQAAGSVEVSYATGRVAIWNKTGRFLGCRIGKARSRSVGRPHPLLARGPILDVRRRGPLGYFGLRRSTTSLGRRFSLGACVVRSGGGELRLRVAGNDARPPSASNPSARCRCCN